MVYKAKIQVTINTVLIIVLVVIFEVIPLMNTLSLVILLATSPIRVILSAGSPINGTLGSAFHSVAYDLVAQGELTTHKSSLKQTVLDHLPDRLTTPWLRRVDTWKWLDSYQFGVATTVMTSQR